MIKLNEGNSRILNIAVPSIISNITVPLLGLIDIAIVGHLGSAAYIGTIAVGTMFFNIIYWIFGFLRMGTSGMTSQAYGRRDLNEVTKLLVRSMGIAFMISAILLILQYPIELLGFALVDTTEEVRQLASLYFRICIWGAPAVLGLWSISGWFIGMQNTRFPMYVAITQNLVNIAVSLILVYGFGMKIEGVALGTLVAQYAGIIMSVILWNQYYGKLKPRIDFRCFLDRGAMKRFFQVNRDIFLRTLCLVAVTVFFTSAGARQGEIILAVNTLMMQFFIMFSYVMDGFAYAGEALVGRYVGSGNKIALQTTIRQLFGWGIALAIIFALVYGFGGKLFLSLLTNDKGVIEASMQFYLWLVIIPISGFLAFLMDGIIIGATATRVMLKAMFVASASFFVVFFSLNHFIHNNALWLAFCSYLFFRGVMQIYWGRKIWK